MRTKRKSQKKTTGPNLTVKSDTPHTPIMSRLLSKTNRFNSKVNLTKRVEAENFVPLLPEDKHRLTEELNKTGYPQYPQKLNLKTQTGIQGEKTKQAQMVKMREKFGGTANIIRIGFNDVLITPKNTLYKPYTVKIGKQSISNPQLVSRTSKPVSTLNLTIPINSQIAPKVSEMLRNGNNNQNTIQKFIEQQRRIGLPPTRPAPSRPPPPKYHPPEKPPQYSPQPPPLSTKPKLVLSSQNLNRGTTYT